MDINSTPRSTKIHGVIVSLLVVLLLTSLSAVGLLVMRSTSAPTTTELTAACQAEVQAAVLDGAREITRVCKPDTAVEPTLGEVPGLAGGVGFNYPLGWSVETKRLDTAATNGGISWRAKLVQGYFASCDSCDGPFIDIAMLVGAKSDPTVASYPDFNAFLQHYYGDPINYTHLVISPSKDVGGERYTVTGSQTGLFSGPFEAIWFEGKTHYANITFLDDDLVSTANNEAWTIVKESLDFSGVQQ